MALSGRVRSDLLASAETDDSAFEELVSYRAAQWLASFDLIEADRGSLDGQEAVTDSGEHVRRPRALSSAYAHMTRRRRCRSEFRVPESGEALR
ncbi:hypothetical protein [Streptomyces katsurahamanus]|uniref:hypothetical protein n=1 Tax=Streptomyces katsurahamanus TaxID=2577098 RepID=UPI0018868129|nr:hypothetical protein [Streptomyces katsurahamanus]